MSPTATAFLLTPAVWWIAAVIWGVSVPLCLLIGWHEMRRFRDEDEAVAVPVDLAAVRTARHATKTRDRP